VSSRYLEHRLSAAARTSLLRGVMHRVRDRSGGRAGGVGFYLDGTVIDNRPRVLAVLHELAEAWRDRHPEASEALSRAELDVLVYGFEENLERLGVFDSALHREGMRFWRARFFADAHIRHDVAMPGARDYVRDCYRAGATIVYLTGRDLPNMALGSFASLRDLGFPIGVVGTELVTKPVFHMSDCDFKRSVASEMSRLGEVLAVFDNEAANCNLFLEAHPACTAIFLDTQCAPNPPELDPSAQVIHTFELEP